MPYWPELALLPGAGDEKVVDPVTSCCRCSDVSVPLEGWSLLRRLEALYSETEQRDIEMSPYKNTSTSSYAEVECQC